MTQVEALQVVARFSRSGGLELDAVAQALLRFAKILKQLDQRTDCELLVPADRTAHPYDGFLARLRLEKGEGGVQVYRDDETLRIKGPYSGLEVLASNVEFLVSSTSRPNPHPYASHHIHEEYYDDHPYLAEDAEPLVINVV